MREIEGLKIKNVNRVKTTHVRVKPTTQSWLKDEAKKEKISVGAFLEQVVERFKKARNQDQEQAGELQASKL